MKMNSKDSVGQYKKVSDVISDLNVMIVEAPINYKFKRQLANMVFKIEQEETLKNVYQFLHEIVHGMFGDNAECVKNAEELTASMEEWFATELTPHDNAVDDSARTYSEQMQDNLEPINWNY
tara:strand:- start:303 stop:668 length:366 start_codon:yes stop_codon:yes gene_type:complete